MHKSINILRDLYNRLHFQPFKKLINRVFELFISKKRNKTVISTVDGITYQLDLNEDIDHSLYFLGYQDINVDNSIKKLCKEGMVVLDIGANIGAYTFKMAKLVGKLGKVIAFEPMSWAFLKLKRNFDLNNFQNIILNKLALSNESKEEKIYFKSSWLEGDGSFPSSQKKELILFAKLDDYLREKGIEKVDFIKLDVDGYELKVLQGAINTLKRHKPIMILETEIPNLEKVGDNIEDLIKFLSNLGYNFYSAGDLNKFQSREVLKTSIIKGETLDVVISVANLLP